jgi:hypothetical protein
VKQLHGAAKLAQERRILREAHEREMGRALVSIGRRDPFSIPRTLRHIQRAHAIQEVIP